MYSSKGGFLCSHINVYKQVIACLKRTYSNQAIRRKSTLRVTGSCQVNMEAGMQMTNGGPGSCVSRAPDVAGAAMQVVPRSDAAGAAHGGDAFPTRRAGGEAEPARGPDRARVGPGSARLRLPHRGMHPLLLSNNHSLEAGITSAEHENTFLKCLC